MAGQSDESIARRHQVSRSTVVLCIEKCLQFGLDAALGELPRSGKPRQLPDDAIAWVQYCACQKPMELGYFYELWTYPLLWGGYAASNVLKWNWWRFNGFGYFWVMVGGIAAAMIVPLALPNVSAMTRFR